MKSETRALGDQVVASVVDLVRRSLAPLQARLDALERQAEKAQRAPLRYLGVHVPGKTYERGAVVTAGGSMWVCTEDATLNTPGDSAPGWQLAVRKGRDGKDAPR